MCLIWYRCFVQVFSFGHREAAYSSPRTRCPTCTRSLRLHCTSIKYLRRYTRSLTSSVESLGESASSIALPLCLLQAATLLLHSGPVWYSSLLAMYRLISSSRCLRAALSCEAACCVVMLKDHSRRTYDCPRSVSFQHLGPHLTLSCTPYHYQAARALLPTFNRPLLLSACLPGLG